jgi:xylulokinase
LKHTNSMNELLLGIDLGTSSIKILLAKADGNIVAEESEKYSIHVVKPGYAEQDPEEWYTSFVKVLQRLKKCIPDGLEKIRAIGVSGQLITMVALDNYGKPVRPAIMWMDQRCMPQVNWINKRFGNEVRSITLTPINTAYTIPRFLWMRENEPELFSRTAHILLSKDYLRYRLTGRFATDFGDASGTLLLDGKARRWSEKIIKMLDIPSHILPPIYKSHEIAGTTQTRAQTETGLPSGIPVVTGSGDLFAENISAGIIYPTDRLIRFGSAGSISSPLDRPALDPNGFCPCYNHALPDKWLLEASTQGFGISMEWFINTIGKGMTSAKVQRIAQNSPKGSHGLFFHPFVKGSPNFDPLFRGAFIGLTAKHSISDLARAMLEGTCYSLRDAKEILDLAAMSENKRLQYRYFALGGGTKSSFWTQMVADVLGVDITLLTSASPALGAVIMAGIGVGIYDGYKDAVKIWMKKAKTIKSDPVAIEDYKKHYEVYRSLHKEIVNISHIIEKHEEDH